MTLDLTNFFKGGYISNERKKEYKETDFIARLMTHTSYIDPDGYARVHNRHLGSGYWRPKQRLQQKGILEVSEDFEIGEYPQGYKLDYSAIDLERIEEVIMFNQAEAMSKNDNRVFLDNGSQRLSLDRIDIDNEIRNYLNIEHFRQMVADRMAPIEISGDNIITPSTNSRSILVYFLNTRTHHIIEDRNTVRARNAFTLQKHVDTGNCFYYEDSQHKKYNVIGDPDLFLEATAQTLLMQAMSFYFKIKFKVWYCYMITSNGREYHTLTNMPAWMRKFLLIDGKHVAESDMKNAQPTTWATMHLESNEQGDFDMWEGTELEGVQDYSIRIKLLRETQIIGKREYGRLSWYLDQHPDKSGFQQVKGLSLSSLRNRFEVEERKRKIEMLNATEKLEQYIDEEKGRVGLYVDNTLFLVIPKDLRDYIQSVTEGRFYERLAEVSGLPSRNDAKRPTLKVAYDKVKNDKMNKLFSKAFPTIKRWIDWYKTTYGNDTFANDCQRHESGGWKVPKDSLYFDYDIAFDGVHDSVVHREDLTEEVNKVLNDKLIESYWLGFSIGVKKY